MVRALEVVVWNAAARRAVGRAMRRLPEVPMLSEPSRNGTRSIVVARPDDLESDAGRRRVNAAVAGRDGRLRCTAAVFLTRRTQRDRRWSTATFRAWTALASRLRDRLVLTADPGAVRRLAFARQVGAEEMLIATAQVEGDELVVWSCEPRRYAAPIAEFPMLAALSERQRQQFEIGSSGSWIHWPAGDVDLGVGSVRERTDPKFREARKAEARAEMARYTAAIRGTRLAHGLKQSDIPGLSERQVRRVERGECYPQIGTLEALAEAHGLSVKEYLAELARRSSARRLGTRG